MRYHYNTVATQKRLSAYSGNKSTFADVSGTLHGFFTPIDNYQRVQSLGIIGQAFEFITDGAKDIKANDIITIDSTAYGVVGVSRYRMASQDILRVYLQLQSNG